MLVTLEVLLDCAPNLQLVEGQRLEHSNDLILDRLEAVRLDLGPASSYPG
jgi:hypothetical protein